MTDEELMREALREAALSDGEVPVGAVVTLGERVIARAHNRRETGRGPFGHAEMIALEEACAVLGTRRLSGCTMYVTLEPCPMCAGAMIMAGLEACVFGAFDSRYGCCGSVYALPMDPAFSHRVRCTGGVLEEEASALLKRFFSRLRRKGSG